jgi:hypothetical protein
MKNRIFKNPITSALGAIIVLASIGSVYIKGVSWSDAGIGITIGVGLLAVKDPGSSGAG